MKTRVCDVCGRVMMPDEYGFKERYALWVKDPVYSEKKGWQRLDICSTCKEKMTKYITEELQGQIPDRDPTFTEVMDAF